MIDQTQPKEEDERSQLSQINLCKLCKQEIAKGAKKCHRCGSSQSRWSRLVHVPVLISFVMMCVAIVQLLEAQRERTLASDALQRAKQAEDTATKAQTKVE